jgi:hypothetical protein
MGVRVVITVLRKAHWVPGAVRQSQSGRRVKLAITVLCGGQEWWSYSSTPVISLHDVVLNYAEELHLLFKLIGGGYGIVVNFIAYGAKFTSSVVSVSRWIRADANMKLRVVTL